MNESMATVFGLLGGLALFIFGMNMMSECLQKAAGEKMKSILALLTKNRIMGVIAGALVTAVLQSSSATTVMAIGSAEFQCDNRIGNRFCQRRIDVLKAGYLCYLRCEHRNNDDSTADGI